MRIKEDSMRAEDILLGSLGFGEDAEILSVERTRKGYRGTGAWRDGEKFSFESTDVVDGLQDWALRILEQRKAA